MAGGQALVAGRYPVCEDQTLVPLMPNVCYWHIAAFEAAHYFGRQRRIADIDQLLLLNLD